MWGLFVTVGLDESKACVKHVAYLRVLQLLLCLEFVLQHLLKSLFCLLLIGLLLVLHLYQDLLHTLL